MKKILNFLICICLHLMSYTQVYDDFSDNNFTHSPVWSGDVDGFMVNAMQQLQLYAEGSGQAYLSTPTQWINGDMEWRFWIKLSFAPSANNYAVFYIMSNKKNLLDTSVHGYYLKFGESGNADAIQFYKRTGDIHELLCRTKDSSIANAFSLYVKLTRSKEGHWNIFTSQEVDNAYICEATAFDTSHKRLNYCGLICFYTQSNNTKFYFDDIYFDTLYVDKTPPFLKQWLLDIDNRSIELVFNETMDSIQLFKTQNYWIDKEIAYPDSIIALTSNNATIRLLYSFDFHVNELYSFTISNLSDVQGNMMPDTALHLFAYQSNLFDVVINEIMAKPSPEIDLPDAEYLELKNRTPFEIDISDWKMIFGRKVRAFERSSIKPYGYLIVTSKEKKSLLEEYGETAELSSVSIVDAGQQIQLLDKNDRSVHVVEFNNSWHNDSKRGGGWSLEMIDFDNPCSEKENWTSSTDSRGGTPGKLNSVYSFNPDVTKPALSHIVSVDSMHIRIFFTEKMLPDYLYNKDAYQIDRNVKVDSVLEINNTLKSVTLLLNKALQFNVIYTLTIRDSLCDCLYNILPIASFKHFGYAQSPDSFDIVINEVLFNPKGNDGVDFVELYNRSGKIINLKEMRLSTLTSNFAIDTGKLITTEGYQLFPDDYLVLTSNFSIVQVHYICKNSNKFIVMNSMPVYTNEEGCVILLFNNQVIDRFDYKEKMHYPLLNSVDGVSLERINPDRKTQDALNWHSAASIVGYATPTYRNSSFCDNIGNTSAFMVFPEVFSPDQDGYNDILTLSYEFKEPGYQGSILIYNISGKKVKTLCNNILFDTKGNLTWDGITDEQIKADVGVYVVVIEYFDLKGEVKREKITVCIATKFK